MFYLYLGYGFVFLATGLLLALQARLPTEIMPRPVLWWLAGFSIIHGLSEWTTLAARLGDAHDHLALYGIAVALSVISFACLAEFGAHVLVVRSRAAKWVRGLPVAIVVAWIAVATAGGGAARARSRGAARTRRRESLRDLPAQLAAGRVGARRRRP